MAKKLKKSCCEKYREKGVACSRCPVVAGLDLPARHALLKKTKLLKNTKLLKKTKKRKKKKGG